MQMRISNQGLCSHGITGWVSHWGWPQGLQFFTGCFPLSISTEICGFTTFWTTALDAATYQMFPLETSCGRIRSPSWDQVLNVFQLSLIMHSCVWILRLGGVGGCRRQFFSCFDDTADLESSTNGGLTVTETQRFCFLLDFQNFLQEEKVGSRQGGREKLGEPQGT